MSQFSQTTLDLARKHAREIHFLYIFETIRTQLLFWCALRFSTVPQRQTCMSGYMEFFKYLSQVSHNWKRLKRFFQLMNAEQICNMVIQKQGESKAGFLNFIQYFLA